MDPLSRKAILPLVRAALREDASGQDATSQCIIPSNLRIRAQIISKTSGVLAGAKLAALVFTTFDRSLRCRLHRRPGARLAAGALILTVEGRARSIFAAERVALNYLGHLSGIATLTQAYARKIRGTRAAILDTRKTVPGLRALEKYAVAVGGGQNHRFDLSDAVLIKTNHLKALKLRDMGQAIQVAVLKAKHRYPGLFIQVEVATLDQLRAALVVRPNGVLLDNFRVSDIRRAVRLARPAGTTAHRVLLEASGGVTLANVRAIANTGVDRISIGRLTHSAPALDVSLRVR